MPSIHKKSTSKLSWLVGRSGSRKATSDSLIEFVENHKLSWANHHVFSVTGFCGIGKTAMVEAITEELKSIKSLELHMHLLSATNGNRLLHETINTKLQQFINGLDGMEKTSTFDIENLLRWQNKYLQQYKLEKWWEEKVAHHQTDDNQIAWGLSKMSQFFFIKPLDWFFNHIYWRFRKRPRIILYYDFSRDALASQEIEKSLVNQLIAQRHSIFLLRTILNTSNPLLRIRGELVTRLSGNKHDDFREDEVREFILHLDDKLIRDQSPLNNHNRDYIIEALRVLGGQNPGLLEMAFSEVVEERKTIQKICTESSERHNAVTRITEHVCVSIMTKNREQKIEELWDALAHWKLPHQKTNIISLKQAVAKIAPTWCNSVPSDAIGKTLYVLLESFGLIVQEDNCVKLAKLFCLDGRYPKSSINMHSNSTGDNMTSLPTMLSEFALKLATTYANNQLHKMLKQGLAHDVYITSLESANMELRTGMSGEQLKRIATLNIDEALKPFDKEILDELKASNDDRVSENRLTETFVNYMVGDHPNTAERQDATEFVQRLIKLANDKYVRAVTTTDSKETTLLNQSLFHYVQRVSESEDEQRKILLEMNRKLDSIINPQKSPQPARQQNPSDPTDPRMRAVDSQRDYKIAWSKYKSISIKITEINDEISELESEAPTNLTKERIEELRNNLVEKETELTRTRNTINGLLGTNS